MAHYDRNSGSHISGMMAQAYRTGGSLEHRLFTEVNPEILVCFRALCKAEIIVLFCIENFVKQLF